jgi:hypothetical protein
MLPAHRLHSRVRNAWPCDRLNQHFVCAAVPFTGTLLGMQEWVQPELAVLARVWFGGLEHSLD